MQVVEPHSHKLQANLIFTEKGLLPYFALDRQVKESDGSKKRSFMHQGERWETLLTFSSSGLAPPESGETPTGREFGLEEVREFELRIRCLDTKEELARYFYANVSPRWQGMESKGDSPNPSVPEAITEGVNVEVVGSNIDFSRYPDLLKAGGEAIGLEKWVWGRPHEMSNVTDAERYVRLNRDKSGPVHARAGPLARIGHLLEGDRSGYRKLEQADSDELGRDRPGYRHMATIGPDRVSHAFAGHDFPREIKHYYWKHWASRSDEDPLAHPKLEVSYQTARWDETIYWHDLESFVGQLDQTIHTVLSEAGLAVSASDDPDLFVRDYYFTASDMNRPDDWILDPELERIEHDQETVVMRYLADGLSPIHQDAIEILASDGGTISPKEIADRADYHVDAVRRALRDGSDLFDRSYGSVQFVSRHIGALLANQLDIMERTGRTLAHLAHAEDKDLDESESALTAFLANLGVQTSNRREGQMVLRCDDLNRSIELVLGELYELWVQTGRDPFDLQTARILFPDGSYGQAHQFIPSWAR